MFQTRRKRIAQAVEDDAKKPLDQVMRELLATVRKLIATVKRERVKTWLVVIALISTAVVGWRVNTALTCIRNWGGKTTDRSVALNGPGGQRINDFLEGYRLAAGDTKLPNIHLPLSTKDRAALIAELDKDRVQYALIGSHAVLMKTSDSLLLAYKSLVKSFRAQAAFLGQSAKHPIPESPTVDCTLW